MESFYPARRALLLAPLFAAVPAAFSAGGAEAAQPDPRMTIITPPDRIQWETQPGFPPGSVETAALWSKPTAPGLYYTLIRWHPGYMSAPHWYATDRYCVVLSGVWWVVSGSRFDPESTVPVPAGGFVRRVARTPHYDGVRKGEAAPAVIAICGIGPIPINLIEKGPAWRQL